MSDSTKYPQLVERIKKFCKDRDWSQFHDPKNLAISLQLEAAEILELFQWTKNNEIKEGKELELADELADALYGVIILANHYNIDLMKALSDKMDKNEEKYPIERSKGKSNKYTEL
jgi:NTP pyrophosphatase (non-canonical NTP hydrolase)